MLARLRILMVTHTYPKSAGDVTAPFMAELVEALVEHGNAVDIVLPFHPGFRQADGSGLRFFPYRYPFDSVRPWGYGQTLRGLHLRPEAFAALPGIAWSLRRCVRRVLAEGKHDIVHAHWVVPNGVLVADAARTSHVPLVLTLHGTDVSIAEKNPLARLATRRAFEQSAAIAAVSGHLGRRAVSIGAQTSNTFIVHSGVRLDRFSPDVSAAGIREELGVPLDAFLVLGVGRLLEAKGFAYLVEAVDRVPGVHILIVGDGPQRRDLETMAGDRHLPVTFAGAMGRERLPRLFAAADAVAVPSIVDRSGQADGGPVTVLEALASGRPLVATRIGVAGDVVIDGVNGLMVAERDVAALAAALERLRDDEGLRARLAAAARHTATHQLGWEHAAREYQQLYERCIELSVKGA